MIHPLFKLVATRPHLVAEHLLGYGELVAMQAAEAAVQLRIRALLLGGMVVGAALAVGLGGMALLLAAAVPTHAMPMPWVLLVVPAVPLLVALGCWLGMRQRPEAWSMQPLREQFAADAALLHEAGAKR